MSSPHFHRVLLPLLILSVAANALLLVERSKRSREEALAKVVASQMELTPEVEVPPSSTPTAPPTPAVAAASFKWSDLESTNYVQFVQNLRRVGCPEQTVRDIVSAEIQTVMAEVARNPNAPFASYWSGWRQNPQGLIDQLLTAPDPTSRRSASSGGNGNAVVSAGQSADPLVDNPGNSDRPIPARQRPLSEWVKTMLGNAAFLDYDRMALQQRMPVEDYLRANGFGAYVQ